MARSASSGGRRSGASSERRSGKPAEGRGGAGGSGRGRGSGKGRKGRGFFGHVFYWSFVLGVWAAIGLGALIAYHASKLPPIDSLAVPKRPPNIAILASDGSLLANRGETGGRTVTLKELPPYLPMSFVAIEDHRFYHHMGIDPVGISRAVFRNLTRGGSSIQGGSTLTQQLAKNLFLTQERTASRKIQEAILALWLERTYSKDQILELYLNRVYFGSGAYGVEAASQKYFGKSARSVTLGEAAVLAGLVQAPSRLAPNRNPVAAQARATLVIAAMAREGFVSDQMAKIALTNPSQPVKPGGAGSVNYAADYVMDVLDDYIGTVDKDIVVRTTIDPAMQATAEKALVDELAQKGDKFGVSQGAVVALQPDGAVKALVGGRSYTDSQFNRASVAKRQPGSAFKPFVYLAALEKGLTPASIREDSPVNVKGWQPENSTREYRGPVSLRQALALSINTVAVKLALEVGPKAVVSTAHRMGVQSKLEPNASIALGTSEVTALELVSAYAPFANGGIAVQPYVITQVRTSDGQTVYRRTGTGLGKVIEPQAVGMMNAMLRETLLTGTGRKAELPGWEAAGKTGTSQEHRDAWFVGYTGSLLAGVWMGNDDGSPTKKTSGSNLPVEVWSRFMKASLASTPPVPLPGGPWKLQWPVPADQGQPAPQTAPMADAGNPIPPEQTFGVAPPAPVGAARGAPLVISPLAQGGPAPQPSRRVVAEDGVLRPPGSVPGGDGGARRQAYPPQERSLLDRLFGG
ncbi:transglycosylase domain-containing protein [Alsobacter sp. SYSU BS001988]